MTIKELQEKLAKAVASGTPDDVEVKVYMEAAGPTRTCGAEVEVYTQADHHNETYFTIWLDYNDLA